MRPGPRIDEWLINTYTTVLVKHRVVDHLVCSKVNATALALSPAVTAGLGRCRPGHILDLVVKDQWTGHEVPVSRWGARIGSQRNVYTPATGSVRVRYEVMGDGNAECHDGGGDSGVGEAPMVL